MLHFLFPSFRRRQKIDPAYVVIAEHYGVEVVPLDIPPGCTEFRCAWSISVAYPGKEWTRVE